MYTKTSSKKEYVKAQMSVEWFDSEDIITTSGDTSDMPFLPGVDDGTGSEGDMNYEE